MRDMMTEAVQGHNADYVELRLEELAGSHISYRARDLEDIGSSSSRGGCARAYVNGAWGFVTFTRLDGLKEKINKQGATVSVQVRTQWVEEAADREKALNRMKEDYNQLGQRRLAEVTQPVYEKVGKFLETYCQQRGIVMLLENEASLRAGILIFAAQATKTDHGPGSGLTP